MLSWITNLVEQGGCFAIAFLMFAENLFPPIPSELIMPLGGFVAARGELNVWLITAAGSVGSLAGAIFWYYVGAWIGTDRLRSFARKHGRWLTMTPKEVDRVDKWFERFGGWAVLIGRLVPGVRTLISVPAGLSEMSFRRFLIYSIIGTVAWTALLTFAGYALESQYEKVQGWLGPVGKVVLAAMVLIYLYRVATFRKRVSRTPDAATR